MMSHMLLEELEGSKQFISRDGVKDVKYLFQTRQFYKIAAQEETGGGEEGEGIKNQKSLG